VNETVAKIIFCRETKANTHHGATKHHRRPPTQTAEIIENKPETINENQVSHHPLMTQQGKSIVMPLIRSSFVQILFCNPKEHDRNNTHATGMDLSVSVSSSNLGLDDNINISKVSYDTRCASKLLPSMASTKSAYCQLFAACSRQLCY
jgi:hypothetical protein